MGFLILDISQTSDCSFISVILLLEHFFIPGQVSLASKEKLKYKLKSPEKNMFTNFEF